MAVAGVVVVVVGIGLPNKKPKFSKMISSKVLAGTILISYLAPWFTV